MHAAWAGFLTSTTAGDAASLALVMVLALLMALWIDRHWGEPPAPFHPVVWMGHYLKACGRLTTRLGPVLAFTLGAVCWCAGATAVGAVAWGVQRLAFEVAGHLLPQLADMAQAPAQWLTEDGPDVFLPAAQEVGAALLTVLVLGWLLKCMLSWCMLRDEAGAVEDALRRSLALGRERLSWLVSRDTATLSEAGVRESAIESLAENLNDSVVAPIFWFLLLGLPGAAVYRFANTADAMWGYRGHYKGQHWEWAGKWAARVDDVLSWLPARLTGLLLSLVSHRAALSDVRREAGKTPSPNSGWPMAAMALALGVSLRKPGVYTLNEDGREVAPPDMAYAQTLAARVVRLLVWAMLPLLVLKQFMGLLW